MAAYKHTNSKGNDSYLHYKDVTLRGGRVQRIYWFAKAEGGKGIPALLPEGYEVVESDRTGLPFIRKKK
jgi:hypothetical protein